MGEEKIIKNIVEELKGCPFIKGIVLGGSRATGTAAADSDFDIGIYYEEGTIDYVQLNAAAKRLDDASRDNLICREGEWGPWVNCGGWLVVDGRPVDLILRNIARVKQVIEKTDAGETAAHYQTGHPHAYLDVMYRGELASCRILYASDPDFERIKAHAEQYPAPLKSALLNSFLFESGFSCMLAKKGLSNNDIYCLTGHVFRSVSTLNQVLFALNEQWCLNEKKAVFRIDTFRLAPLQYSMRVSKVFEELAPSPDKALEMLERLCEETKRLCESVSTKGL